MSLIVETLWGKENKVERSIKRLKEFEPEEGYYLAFSGGKDSCVIKALCDMAKVKYDAHYSLTTVDPPELIYFIKEHHNDVEIIRPKESMWTLIPRKLLPPTMRVRYCCDILKEEGGKGRFVVTGVRWEESVKRKKRHMIEFFKGKKMLNPILDWTTEDVWEFIHQNKISYCKLYDEGFERLGCIMCPLNPNNMEKEAERYPKYKANYLRAFKRMLDERERKGKDRMFKDEYEVYDWWLGKLKYEAKQIEGQCTMFE